MTAATERRFVSDVDIARMGREWAHHHLRQPGSPVEPCKYGNLVHDKACADEWFRVTGKRLPWDDSPPRRGELGYNPYPDARSASDAATK